MQLSTATRITALCAAVFFLKSAAAQDQPIQPVIRVNTRLVEVDVVVRNKDGPVPGLTKQDFTVLDKGKPQEIAVFTFRSKAGGSAATVQLPPGLVSNRVMEAPQERTPESGEAPTGATVILVDRLNTAFEFQPYLRQQMLDVLGSMKAGSPIALYILGGDLSVVHDFTEDTGRLIRAAAILKNKGPAQNQAAQSPADVQAAKELKTALEEVLNLEQVDRPLTTAQALERIAKHLSVVHGRKSLVWLSGSFPLVNPRILRGTPDVERIGDTTQASNEGNMAIYPVDVKGLSAAIRFSRRASGPIDPPGAAVMETLARDTGGRAFFNSNDISGAIQQAMDDAEVTYTLGFYPQASSLDGKFHPLQVKVAKVDLAKGAEVRYREGYIAAEVSASKGVERSAGLSIEDVFDDPLDANAVGLEAIAHPAPGKPGTFTIEVKVDVADLHLEQTGERWTGSFDLAVQMPNADPPKGKVHRFEIHATGDELRELLSKGFVHREAVEGGGGAGSVRVVVQDRNTGAAGSLRVPLVH
jgi:VWFA-related protein